MSATKPSWFTIIGSTTLGLGFLATGLAQFNERRRLDAGDGPVGQVGRGGLLRGRLAQGAATPELPAPDGREGDSEGLARATADTHDVKNINERVALIVKLIRQGATDPEVAKRAHRLLARKCDSFGRPIPRGMEEKYGSKDVKWCVPEKNCMAEVKALYDAVKNPQSRFAVRYVRDSIIGDVFTAAKRTLLVNNGGDCLPAGTLLLTRDRGYQPIELLREGDEVQGDGVWTKVTRWWDKGTLPTLTFKLNNGAVLTCTAEHRLFVVPKVKGATSLISGAREEAVEIRAGDVKPGDELLLAATQPAGERSLDPELAWLVGVFVADGWLDGERIAIAGRDRVEDREYGKKDKGPQKDRIAAFCEARGIVTHRTDKDIRFRDAELHELLSRCGKGALHKQLPFTDVDAPTARAMLDGLMADASTSKAGTIVYSTVSAMLALQIRALHRILGVRTNIRRVVQHGGFGSNPIYRVSVVRSTTATGRRGMLHGKVESIGGGAELPVFDIETDTHRFYLPETDLVVHNCDDFVVTLGSLLMAIGHPVTVRVIQTKDKGTWNHVYLTTPKEFDKTGADVALPLDPTVDRPMGWEAPGASEVARTGKPTGIVKRVKDFPVAKPHEG